MEQLRRQNAQEINLTIFRMSFFWATHEWRGGQKGPTSQNLSHISYNDETWLSYNLPKECSKK